MTNSYAYINVGKTNEIANNWNAFTMQLAQFPFRYTKTIIKEKYSCHSCMAGPTSVNKPNHQKPNEQKYLVFNCLAIFKHRVASLMRIDHIK